MGRFVHILSSITFMAEQQEKIIFTTEDELEVAFYVLDQTKINGVNYLLVADSIETEGEANALILREQESINNIDNIYNIVDDDDELIAISKVFEEMLEDVDIAFER